MLIWLARLFALILSAVLVFAAWMAWFAFRPAALSAPAVDFSIRSGSGLKSATRQIIDAGVEMDAWKFNLLGRALMADTSVKAGTYSVEPGVTPWEVMRKIRKGDVAQSDIVFIEGWTFRQIREALKAHRDIEHESDALSDEEIMVKLGVPDRPAEGMFFPDTYVFGKGESDLKILARAHRAMQKHLQTAWERRVPELPLANAYEALILASIVEKETGKATDRGMIAGVFVNRLRLHMKLQTDPTVIYGMGEKFDGNLRKKDLTTDTPFNTYTRAGLPPHPIATPGLAAISAVMSPAKTDALYFVARGDGTSEFSPTLADHNRAVVKFQLSGRKKNKS